MPEDHGGHAAANEVRGAFTRLSAYDQHPYGNKRQKPQRGNATDYTYDANNNSLLSVSSGDMTNSYTYEQDRLKTINVNGALQYQFAYDVFGRTTSTKVGNGTSFRTLSSMTYNNAGLLARQTYGNGDYIDFTYDSLDRITRKQYNGSSTNRMEYLYGSDGSVAQTIDYAANTHTKFVYDLAGRLVSQREYGGVTQLPSYPNAYTNFTYADKTNYLTGIKHVSPLGTQNIGYRYGDLSKQEMPDQIYGVSWNGEEKLSYTYDGLGRLTNKALKVKDDPENGTLNMGYVYEDVGEGERTTTLLKRLLFAGNPLLDYTYDAVGNITSICDGSLAQSFEYDDLNQLVRFNDRYQNKTFTYEYENGNITFEHEYAYTTGELPATPKRSTQYHYDDPAWSDVLTGYSTLRYTSDGKAVASINSVEEIKDRAQSDAYARRFLGDRFKKVDLSKNSLLRQNAKTASVVANGNVIVDDTVSLTVDEIGNLTGIDSIAQLKWNGRQLQDIVMEDGKISYAYNADGQRISKTLAQFGEESVTTEYFYNGEILAGQKTGNDVLVFMYDNNGDIFGFTYNGKPYYYIKNAQNDVMFIVDPEEGAVVLYTYDAWGNVTGCYDASENNIGTINPITYRSYYYDFELGMYYLNSRYYMPALHRFINADGYASTGQGMLGHNMFAYCLNNPVNMMDPNGNYCVSFPAQGNGPATIIPEPGDPPGLKVTKKGNTYTVAQRKRSHVSGRTTITSKITDTIGHETKVNVTDVAINYILNNIRYSAYESMSYFSTAGKALVKNIGHACNNAVYYATTPFLNDMKMVGRSVGIATVAAFAIDIYSDYCTYGGCADDFYKAATITTISAVASIGAGMVIAAFSAPALVPVLCILAGTTISLASDEAKRNIIGY